RKGPGQEIDLGIAVESHGVVVSHAPLHATGGVEHENIEPAELLGDRAEHSRDGCRIGQVGTDRYSRTALRLDLRDELEGSRLLIAVVDDDACAGLRKIADSVSS